MTTRQIRPELWRAAPVRGRVALIALAWVFLYLVVSLVVSLGGLLLLREVGDLPHAGIVTLIVFNASAIAGILAVWLHVVRRRGPDGERLGWQAVGWCRPRRSMAALLWQLPLAMVAAITASGITITALSADEGAGSASEDAIEDLVLAGPAVAVLGFVAIAILVPIFEELVFRGVIFSALRARLRAAWAIGVCAALFAVVHLVPIAIPYLLVMGVALAWLTEWYRSIVPALVVHGVNNTVVFVGAFAALQSGAL